MSRQSSGVLVCNHPLIAHKLGLLRDKESSITRFRELTREIGIHLAYEATRDLSLEEKEIDLALPEPELNVDQGVRISVPRLSSPKPVLMPVMRSGLTLAEGVLQAIPFARMGHFGFEPLAGRTESYEYFYAIPPIARQQAPDQRRRFYVTDVAVATGGVMSRCLEILLENGVLEEDIDVIALIGCSPGLERVTRRFPQVGIFVAAVDDEVRDGFAYPGIGNNNYRLFGV